MATPTESVAPLTGTIHYPVHALVTLAKFIIKDVQAHHTALRDAPYDTDDDDTILDESDNLIDIYNALIQVEPPPLPEDRYVGEYERSWLEDPRFPEQRLLQLGRLDG